MGLVIMEGDIMNTATRATMRSRGARYLVLLGLAGLALGIYLLLNGIPSLFGGHWFGANGGLTAVLVGAGLFVAGIRAFRSGRRVQKSLLL